MLMERITRYATSGRMDDPYTFMGLMASEGAIPGVAGRSAPRPRLAVIDGRGPGPASGPSAPGSLPKAA